MKTVISSTTKLLIQPEDGDATLINAIDQARETIHIVIFRFDRHKIEAALKRAARRGVFVHALVAHTSAGQGGERTLRSLEMRLLADGVSVARTAADLVRYHDKLMIIDGETLFVLAFNYTTIDIELSRSFGIITNNPEWVREAERLFVADTMRQPYTPECDSFIVSPGNARRQLMALLSEAHEQILIYDDKLSDPAAMRLLSARMREGIDVRIIGTAGKRAQGVPVAPLFMRLHAQIIVCDGKRMFLGSQSLRTLELDARREVGVLLDDPEIIRQVVSTFEADWRQIHSDPTAAYEPLRTVAAADEGVDSAANDCLSPAIVAHLVKSAVKEAIKDALLETLPLNADAIPLKETVKEAAKEAMHEFAL
jgi:phosphatidylserine/phosphatidylglycerophosphate/cardiolipin synthase-like enzyme